ncbi:MAG TPA: hypothetical protein VEI02_12575 [Planctomycetota bacterium]|nr:hypothetical protein [Planctomycetota bacterium]
MPNGHPRDRAHAADAVVDLSRRRRDVGDARSSTARVRPRGARAAVVAVLVAAAAAAQGDSRPADDGAAGARTTPPFPTATADAMLRLRDGSGTLDDLKAVVDAETAAGRLDAVAWWLATAEPALASASPAAKTAAAAMQRELRKRRAAPQEDRALVARSISRADALLGKKNVDSARKAAAGAAALLEVLDVPDAAKTFAALREKLEKAPAGDADAREAERDRVASAATVEAGRKRFDERLAALLAQYEAAGCRVGRTSIERALASGAAASWLSPANHGAATIRLRRAARLMEKSRALKLMARYDGRVSFFLECRPLACVRSGATSIDATLSDGVELAVLPGDRVQVAFAVPDPEELEGEPVDPTVVALVGAALDGAAVPASGWKLNLSGDPTKDDAKLRKAPVARKTKNKLLKRALEDAPDEVGDGVDAWRNAEWILEVPDLKDGMSAALFPFVDELVAWQTEAEEKGFKPIWFGAISKKFVLAYDVPE